MRSFEADEDLLPMLEAAEAAGVVFKDLINKALKKHGADALREIADEMREAAAKVESVAKRQNISSRKG